MEYVHVHVHFHKDDPNVAPNIVHVRVHVVHVALNKHPPSVVCSSHKQTYIPEEQDVTTESSMLW